MPWKKLFDVAPDAFDPPPQVVSSVVRMVPLNADRPRPRSEAALSTLVMRAFSQRRKMLRRSLSDWAADIASGTTLASRPPIVQKWSALRNTLRWQTNLWLRAGSSKEPVAHPNGRQNADQVA